MQQDVQQKDYSFTKKVWITGGIFSLFIIIILLFKATFSVLLLIFAGSLIALFFRGFGGMMHRLTKWKQGACVGVAVLITVLFFGLLFWLIGSKVASQANQLSETLPKTVEQAKSYLNQSPLGTKVLDKLSSPAAQKKAKAFITTFFKSTFGVVGDLYVVLFIGIYFTVSPNLYKKGIVALVPSAGKQKANEVLTTLGSNLQKWLKGKIFAMFVVFVLTAIGLTIIGIPLWLVLALIAGILNFIPNFGPLIALIPAVLISLMQGFNTALWVAGLYIVVQILESNFITPMVQKKLIQIPPALIIIAQLLISPLTGGWGLVLATPLMLVIMVLVKNLYIQNQQGNHNQ